ncbi:MAG: hypothetical protein H6741_08565 [Alphaproteobacteria bacterium]|nr:hypothetical protein [Alphaproteobacteria bacterium]MCB9792770.1 hypothetical protein [Alphaproteobacteria bacterium]
MRRLGPHLLGVFVLYHLIGITLMSIPAPGGGMNRTLWKDPTVQGEFQVWTERFNAWGWDITSEDLEDELWDFAVAYMNARTQALAPFEPYYEYTGSTQTWRMFIAPHRFPARLEIDVEEAGAWRTVYRARDPELDWLGRELDHDRMRAAIFRFPWPPYRGAYGSFVKWLGPQAARDFPEATRARVRFFKYRTPSPEETLRGEAPEGQYTLARTLELAPLREAAP